MNISKAIKEQRNMLSLSQEELAEKLYVTRQTIGNWENEKSYPDIHSLILLSQIFDMTIDNLIKGDLEIMKQSIEVKDIGTYKRCITIGTIGFIVGMAILTLTWIFSYFATVSFIIGMVIGGLIAFIGLAFLIKSERTEDKYDVHTFKEIIAFTKGETLDEIAKARESEKRMYQIILLLIAGLLFTAGCIIVILLLSPNF